MPTVQEVIHKCREIGLEVQENFQTGGHSQWKIVDPGTGAVLTGIAATPSDHNWFWNIRRQLRRAGFRIEFGPQKKKGGSRKGKGRGSIIDLDALRRAQARAEAEGVRVPLLEDLEDSTEFFKRVKSVQPIGHSDEQMQEVIDNMAPREDAPRLNATRSRLERVLLVYGEQLVAAKRERKKAAGEIGGKVTPIGEFVSIALDEIGPARGLRVWPNNTAGTQGVAHFLKGRNVGLWMVNLMEATMDHIEGLKFGEIDETRIRTHEPEPIEPRNKPVVPPAPAPTEAELLHHLDKVEELEPVPTAAELLHRREAEEQTETYVLVSDADRKAEYFNALLDLLKNTNGETPEGMLDRIFERLDKLAGIA